MNNIEKQIADAETRVLKALETPGATLHQSPKMLYFDVVIDGRYSARNRLCPSSVDRLTRAGKLERMSRRRYRLATAKPAPAPR